jgi:chromosome segregation ATPase
MTIYLPKSLLADDVPALVERRRELRAQIEDTSLRLREARIKLRKLEGKGQIATRGINRLPPPRPHSYVADRVLALKDEAERHSSVREEFEPIISGLTKELEEQQTELARIQETLKDYVAIEAELS